MIRAVLDTNTLVSAIINKPLSVSQEIYQNFINKRFLLIVSPSLLAEVEDVVQRSRVRKFHKRSSESLQKIIGELANLSFLVPGKSDIKIVRDPDDDKIIATALEGKADYIVSRDLDLLDLKEFKKIKIISPEEFMRLLRSE